MKLRSVSFSTTKARHLPSLTSRSNCKPKFKSLRSKASHIDLLTVLRVRLEKRIIKREIRKERNKERNRDWHPTNLSIWQRKTHESQPFPPFEILISSKSRSLRVWDEIVYHGHFFSPHRRSSFLSPSVSFSYFLVF